MVVPMLRLQQPIGVHVCHAENLVSDPPFGGCAPTYIQWYVCRFGCVPRISPSLFTCYIILRPSSVTSALCWLVLQCENLAAFGITPHHPGDIVDPNVNLKSTTHYELIEIICERFRNASNSSALFIRVRGLVCRFLSPTIT